MRLILAHLLLSATSGLASIGKGHTWSAENKVFKRQGPQGTTEGSAATVEEPTEECSPYGLPEIAALLPEFPTVWTVAEILSNDSEALSFMQQINSSGLIPTDILPRGTPPNSYSGADLAGNYDLANDPDCWWTDKGCSQPKHAGLLADVVSCPEPNTWGYTFDDGPNCTHNALYDFWKTQNQKVSLMYIGSNVLDWPLEAQRGVTDGHHICAHTWSHRYMTSLTTDEAFAELWYTVKAIKYVMGITVTCWRPPYGDVDDRIRAIAQSMGLQTIMWSDDTDDWDIEPYGPSPTASIQANYASIQSKGSSPAAATGGIIVLEHEIEDAAMNLSMQEYSNNKAAWKYIVPIAACLNKTNPYYEDYTFPDFAAYIAGTVNPSPSGQTSIAIQSASYSLVALATASATVTSAPTATNIGGSTITAGEAPVVGPQSTGVASSSAGSVSSSSGSTSSGSSTSSGALITAPSYPLLLSISLSTLLFKFLA